MDLHPPVASQALGRRELRRRLEEVSLRDERRLTRRLGRLRGPVPAQFVSEVLAAESRLADRAAVVPAPTYPENLPVTGRREDILAALRAHQVLVVAGETGSGKTTQLPKMLLESGRGVRGWIGHTQPRRLAARTVAERIGFELADGVDPIPDIVGHKVRFADTVGPSTLIKVMTDGVLLAEIRRDPDLLAYDALIVDEAHERSVTIDVLLGYLTRLLPRRPDLSVVVTSATIDTQRFSEHFGGAPIIEVSGRTYPVEIRYRPLDEPVDHRADSAQVRDQVQGVLDAVDELVVEAPGDILVFLSGEREIRETAEALREHTPHLEVLPLFARLSTAEQRRVFAPHDQRRVILATNVAETSLTVPGVRSVVDAGTARISRFSRRTKVQRLPIEAVSQASANQRSGRCGRVADGICIRLYSEQDFTARPEFTEPEILRTSLASVLLLMASWGVGEIEDFPFVDPPDQRQVRDGLALLHELGALSDRRLTDTGRQLARLPVDPRFGRMLVEAEREGALRELLIVVSALSIQDVREWPSEERQQAAAAHARFADPTSDLLGVLALWDYLRELRHELSSSAFRRRCRAEYLHSLRIREWQDLHAQLRAAVADMGWVLNDAPASSVALHRSALAGLLSHIGLRDRERGDFLGARNARFAIAPGSALHKKTPTWVVAAELVETSRLWARQVARIEPEWVEPLAGHLVVREYSEPRWDRQQARVIADERVTLYGLPLVARRPVGYASIDAEASRDLFLRHALVQREWDARHDFLAANRATLRVAAEAEHRLRRRDVVVDDDALLEFYSARIPADVVSGRHFDAWWRRTRPAQPHLLTLSDADVLALMGGDDGVGGTLREAFPDAVALGGELFAVRYRFAPGTDEDGVSVLVPLASLPGLDLAVADWLVPGMRDELVLALVRALPKALRRSFVPAPTYAAEVQRRLPSRPAGHLVDAVAAALTSLGGPTVTGQDFDRERLPEWLRPRLVVVDEAGTVLDAGRDPGGVRRRLLPAVVQAVADAAPDVARTGLTSWPGSELRPRIERVVEGRPAAGFPALTDEGTTVGVQILGTVEDQARAMRWGTARLVLLAAEASPAEVLGGLGQREKAVVAGGGPYVKATELAADCLVLAADVLVRREGGVVWEGGAFTALVAAVRPNLMALATAMARAAAEALLAALPLRRSLSGTSSLALVASLADARSHLDRLLPANFVRVWGADGLRHLGRWLAALQRRVEVLPGAAQRDGALMARACGVEAEVNAALASLGEQRRGDDDVRAVVRMVEELRVSLFAQRLGTSVPVSEKRVLQELHGLR